MPFSDAKRLEAGVIDGYVVWLTFMQETRIELTINVHFLNNRSNDLSFSCLTQLFSTTGRPQSII